MVGWDGARRSVVQHGGTAREGAGCGLVRALPAGSVIIVSVVTVSSAWAAGAGWLAEWPPTGASTWDPAAPVRAHVGVRKRARPRGHNRLACRATNPAFPSPPRRAARIAEDDEEGTEEGNGERGGANRKIEDGNVCHQRHLRGRHLRGPPSAAFSVGHQCRRSWRNAPMRALAATPGAARLSAHQVAQTS